MAKSNPHIQKNTQKKSWETCQYCPMQSFKTSPKFTRHLREHHCTKEGGSYVCRYGLNAVCPSHPLDGCNLDDYDAHVQKYHVEQIVNEPEWSIYSFTQNLPAVLNDPNRGKQTNLFTKKWGDSFIEKSTINPSEYLNDVIWDDFRPYIKKIGKRFRRHVRLSISLENNSLIDSSKSKIVPFNSSHGNENCHNVVNLNDIPQIFLKSSLDLRNPTIFSSVFPEIGDNSDKCQKSGKLLQEQLSHYLDIVEVQIAKQVSQKSSAFFHAMTSQDTIMECMNEATKNVKQIRKRLNSIDLSIVLNSFKILQEARKRQNSELILEKLKLMATVHQTQPMIQLLLGTQDYVAALDLIGTTQEIVAQELIGIHCFRHLPLQLKEMGRLIDKMLNTEFQRYSTADLNRPFNDSDENDQIIEEDKLVCIIMGLLREKNFGFIDTYKDEAIMTVQAIIKQIVIEVISTSDNELCLRGGGEDIQTLTIPEWIKLLQKATKILLKLLKRIKMVLSIMLQTADASAGKISDCLNFIDSEVFLTETDHKIVVEKLNDLIKSLCNYCNERCANLVSNQSLENAIPTANDIENLTNIIELFNKCCKEISGINSIPLQTALNVHATRFEQKFHSKRKSKLGLILDSERWKQVDIPNEFQKLIDRISENDFNFSKFEFNTTNKCASPVLLVDGTSYTLVGSVLILVQIVIEYCKCAEKLPIIASQLSRDVIDLLRKFNSRSCQLILGAGAVHIAGLKTITSGNLALVSRALQLILWLLPKVKTHFYKLDINSIAGYNALEKDYLNHIKGIESKIYNIVTSLVISQLEQWDARPPVPSQSFRNISKHFIKLHEAISSILPEQQIQAIYCIVHRNFKDKLRETLLKYNIINNGGPEHGVVTSELTFYLETLKTLKAFPQNELNDNMFDDIWLK